MMSRRSVKGGSLKSVFGLVVICFVLIGASVSYSAEIDDIRTALRANGATWEAGENPISMLPPEERIRKLGALEPKVDMAQAASEPLIPLAGVALPYSFNWANSGYVPPVRDQGNCGSCWAFAATAALESKVLISGHWPWNPIDLSEQIVLSCSGAGDCYYGGYISQASDFLVSTGTGKESCYPYTVSDGYCGSACNWHNRPYQISGWSWVASGSPPSASTLKNAIYNYGPVIVQMYVYTDFFYYTGGVYSAQWGNLEGGHAIVAVGWDDYSQAFIVKNSWGTGWGEAGFFWIAYSELKGYSNFARYAIAYGNVDTSLFSAHLLSPNGAESLATGVPWTIQWEAPYNAKGFKLSYSVDSGLTWKPIAGDIPAGTTSYPWTPVEGNNRTNCFVKVQEVNASGANVSSDKSDKKFKIEVVKLTAPNGYESWGSGSSQDIYWTTNTPKRDVAKVKLSYTKNGGTTWNLITKFVGENPGHYSWTLPTVTTTKTNCKVKVELKDAVDNTIGSDVSDYFFTIY
jgi:C1A family cysteine protease